MGRLEALLAAIFTENSGRFHSALEASVELFERLTLAGGYIHTGSFLGSVCAQQFLQPREHSPRLSGSIHFFVVRLKGLA
jgi:hypothetical protein